MEQDFFSHKIIIKEVYFKLELLSFPSGRVLSDRARSQKRVYLGVKTCDFFFFVFYLCCLERSCTLLFQYLCFLCFPSLLSLADFYTELEPNKVVLRSKNTFIFSSDFKTLFTKQSPKEILGLNFEKKTVYLNFNFPIYWSAIITPESIQ